MKIKHTLLIILLILLAGLTISSASAAKVDELVLQKAAADGKVKVIISLNEPPRPLFSLQSESQRLRTQQADVISELKTSNIKHRYSIINGFAGELSVEDIARLEADHRVEKISYDRPMHILLNEARPQINATKVNKLQINSYNLTGVGQTVCVIDTGINYSHPDLADNYLGGWDFVNNDNDSMDDNGHGTHVSGIAAANGTIVGIAPGSKIIAIKSMNSGGSGFESDVLAGINWCTNNRTLYNISVISMSIGGGQNSTYCDNSSGLTSAINSAIANNISIITATGNTEVGYPNATAGVADPACITNSTRVSSVGDADVISSFGFRHTTFTDMLLAPGENIISTNWRGGTQSMSGTSMSTPMVAGAAAILKQFNNSLTPQEIEDALEISGKQISDSGTGLTFPRINILEAIYYLNNTAPNITSFYPETNISIAEPSNQTFNITYTDAENNAQVYWYENGTFVSNLTNYTFFGNYTTAGTYNITIIVKDTYESDSVAWMLTIDNTNRAPNIISWNWSNSSESSTSLEDIAIDENSSITFNITADDSDNDTLSYSWRLNLTQQATTQNWTYTADFTSSGIYPIKLNVSDGDLNNSESWSLTVRDFDTTPIFSTVGNKSWYIDDTYTTDLDNYASDADGDNLNYTSTTPNHVNVSINNDTAVVTFTPESGWTGEDEIIFYAFDPQGNKATSNKIMLEVVELPGNGNSGTTTTTSPTTTPTTTTNETTTTTTPTPTTLPTPTLETLSEPETEKAAEEGSIATTGFAAKLGEFFGSIAEIKWSTWLIIVGIIAAALSGGFFVHKRRMFGRVGEKLEEDFEESVKEWKGKETRANKVRLEKKKSSLADKVKGIFKSR